MNQQFPQSFQRSDIGEYAAPTELVNIWGGLIYKDAAPLALSDGEFNAKAQRRQGAGENGKLGD